MHERGEYMGRIMKKTAVAAMLISMLLCLSACSDTVEVVKLCPASSDFVSYYGDVTFQNETKATYEKIYSEVDFFGYRFSIGPTDPQYRGGIYISEEDANDILSKYEWSPAESVELNCENVDLSGFEGCEWLTSPDFEREMFSCAGVNACYFNGENAIYFDIQTY